MDGFPVFYILYGIIIFFPQLNPLLTNFRSHFWIFNFLEKILEDYLLPKTVVWNAEPLAPKLSLRALPLLGCSSNLSSLTLWIDYTLKRFSQSALY